MDFFIVENTHGIKFIRRIKNDFHQFGENVLSGVPMNNLGGAYMITTEVPFNGSNISMPSVNN